MSEYRYPKLDGGRRDDFNLGARPSEDDERRKKTDVIAKMKAKREAQDREEKKAESDMRMIHMRFVQAIKDGNLDVIADLCDMHNNLANTPMRITDPNKDTRPIMAAVVMGRVDILCCLMDHGGDADFEYRINAACSTPATLAASYGYTDMMREFHERGVAIDKANTNGITPLFEAARHAKVDTVRALIDLGANVLHESPNGMNFMTAIEHTKDNAPELVQIYDQAQKARFDAITAQGAPMRVKLVQKIKIK